MIRWFGEPWGAGCEAEERVFPPGFPDEDGAVADFDYFVVCTGCRLAIEPGQRGFVMPGLEPLPGARSADKFQLGPGEGWFVAYHLVCLADTLGVSITL